MEATDRHAPCASGTCHVVMLCGAGFVLMTTGVMTVFQTDVSKSWCNSTCVLAVFIGGIMFCMALWRLVKSDVPSIVDTKTEQESQSKRYMWTVALIVSAVILVLLSRYVTSHLRGRALVGFFALLLMEVAFSTNRRAINWKLVIGGILCQLLLGAVLLSCRPVFNVIARATHVGIAQLQHILLPGAVSAYVKVVLLAVVWGAVALFLFLSGVFRALLNLTSCVLRRTLGASATDTLLLFATGTSCSFEAIVSLRRYLVVMTHSELHLLMTVSMTASFGHLIPLYVALKFPLEYIVIFNILAAPAAVAVAKLSHPETQHPRSWHDLDLDLSFSPAQLGDNLLENGKTNASDISDDTGSFGQSRADAILQDGKAILKAIVMLVGFGAGIYGVLALVDMALIRLQLTDMCLYTFMPLTAALGIGCKYIDQVARLLGMKLLLHDVTCYASIRDSLVFDRLDNHNAVISFFACSGAANINCLVLLTTLLVSLRITRKDTLLSLVGRAFVDANVVAFLTACVAGIFYADTPLSFIG